MCIRDRICVKNCPVNAVRIEDSHAVIDEEKCIACGMCAVKCPRGVIIDYDGIFKMCIRDRYKRASCVWGERA